jgi:hypothetical protein
MRWVLANLPVFLALSGCGHIQSAETEAAQITHDAAMSACEKAYPEKFKKPTMPRVKCINEANAVLAAHDQQAPDLVRVMSTQRVVASERYDAGQITESQYASEDALIYSEFQSKVLDRHNERTIANAASDQADAAWQAARKPAPTINIRR